MSLVGCDDALGRVRRYRQSMAWSRFRTPGAVDAAVALFFTLALQLEVWIWWVPEEMGPKPFAAAMGLLNDAAAASGGGKHRSGALWPAWPRSWSGR